MSAESLHAAATLGMAGLIWFVQVVHYPLFLEVREPAFTNYAQQHVRRTTWVVAPLMFAELGTALWLLGRGGPTVALYGIGLGLLAVIWLSTAMLQVPCHRQLEQGFDIGVARRLVRTNWVRTLAWSARAVLALWVLAP